MALGDISMIAAEGVKLELAVELLRFSQPIYLRAWGSSMLPTIWPGDPLLIQNCPPDEIAVGDIICFRQLGRLVIHRVINIQRTPDTATAEQPVPCRQAVSWITRGDSAAYADVPATGDQLLGRVFTTRPSGDIVQPRRRLSLSLRLSGRLLARMDSLQGTVVRLRILLRRWQIGEGRLGN